MSQTPPEKPLMEFPCDFVIKVIGKHDTNFMEKVTKIAKQHFPDLKESDIAQRDSNNKQYCALTISVYALSQAQLDAVYYDLSSCPEVIMAL